MWWAGDQIGWVIETRHGLTPSELERSIEFTLKVQKDRYSTLLPGERKDECMRTIVALAEKRVQQNIVGMGDHVIFDAYSNRGLSNVDSRR
jgi:hypothetical protein